MRYAVERFKQYERDEACRIFVTDALKVLTENTQRFAGGRAMSMRYYDLVHPAQEVKQEETGDEIIARLKGKLKRMSEER